MDRLPELITDRLRLNEFKTEDIPAIVKYAGNKNVAANTSNIPHPYTVAHAEEWIKRTSHGFNNGSQYSFAIRQKDSNKFIGGIGIHPSKQENSAEIGFWIGEPHWNLGYTSEALSAILKFAFQDLALHKVIGTHLVHNLASGKVMRKNGMICEGPSKEEVWKGDVRVALIKYAITKEEHS